MPHTIGIDRSDKSSHYRNLHQHLSDDENEDPSEHRNVVLPVHREAQKNGLIHKVHHHSSSSHHNSDHIHSLPSISHHPSHHSNSIHYQHPHVTYTGHNLGLLMLFDGIGLALITTATVLEGFDMWSELFSDHWSTNSFGLSCWLTGRTCQIIGLMFLIGHASSFQVFPDIERFGMLMLTIGPILNFSSYVMFRSIDNPNWWYNRAWLSSETFELAGIFLLDVSLIDMEEILVLSAEVSGFFLLCCAAGLHFEYHLAKWVPSISLRLDVAHSSECIGLIMLTIVAFCQYRMKLAKHEHESKHGHHPRSELV